MTNSATDKKNNKAGTLELAPEIAEGSYTNFTSIIATPTEFTLDFIQIVPGVDKAKVKARIILTPHTAKGLLRKLQESVEDYEKHHEQANQEETAETSNSAPSKARSKEVMNYPLGSNIVGEA